MLNSFILFFTVHHIATMYLLGYCFQDLTSFMALNTQSWHFKHYQKVWSDILKFKTTGCNFHLEKTTALTNWSKWKTSKSNQTFFSASIENTWMEVKLYQWSIKVSSKVIHTFIHSQYIQFKIKWLFKCIWKD